MVTNLRTALVEFLAVGIGIICVECRMLPGAAGGAVPVSPERLNEVISGEVLNGFSGAVLVADNEHVIFNKGYGAIRGVQMMPDSRFWIASSGKQFTFAAVMKCNENGWLKLDDPISRFFPDAPADKHSITVRQLMSHTSGLGQSYVSEGHRERAEAVRAMLAEPLVDVPSHKFSYSNSNHQLAVAIVEIASRENYKDFVEQNLLRPAGLNNTGFGTDAGGKKIVPARNDTPQRLFAADWGGEGYYSTALDLYNWYRALNAGRVISSASVRLLFEPVTKISEGEAALGWFMGKTEKGAKRIFTRGNEDWGPNSLIYAYPDTGIVIVVLTHAGNAGDGTSWSRFVHAKIENLLDL